MISGKSIRGILHYNEDKVARGEARLILANEFAGDISAMSIHEKCQRFENLTMLNARVKTNALHISLNFDPSEKLSDKTLQQIAISYMEKIGFDDQPFLVYRHSDAAHPHLHIATTTIRPDGSRIDIHGIGRTLSETARREIETEYGLVAANSRQKKEVYGVPPADLEKAHYGKRPTKQTISNIVGAVVRSYKFTSLAELNAILKQFNVIADRGREDTEMFRKKGLIYSILNKEGEKIGVPIKSSSLYGKPTLPNLEKKFEQNKERRKPHKEALKTRIDRVFNGYQQITATTFASELRKQAIETAFRQNEKGYIYGITFVDNKHKTVFNGSALGKAYSAKALTSRFAQTDQPKKTPQKTYLKTPTQTRYLKQPQVAGMLPQPGRSPAILKTLLTTRGSDYGPQIPRKKKKKKQQAEQHQQITT